MEGVRPGRSGDTGERKKEPPSSGERGERKKEPPSSILIL